MLGKCLNSDGEVEKCLKSSEQALLVTQLLRTDLFFVYITVTVTVTVTDYLF
jgi:hypothetical protein